LPITLFNVLLGTLLVIASAPLLLRRSLHEHETVPRPTLWAYVAGGVIGLLSGLTGMGGGVLLAPLLIYSRWSDTRTATGLSAAFIFLNSVVALLGHWSAGNGLPTHWMLYALGAVLGGAMGAHLGSRYFSVLVIRRLLGLILLAGGLRLIAV
jgi:uncharacterized membrane protein YfcA